MDFHPACGAWFGDDHTRDSKHGADLEAFEFVSFGRFFVENLDQTMTVAENQKSHATKLALFVEPTRDRDLFADVVVELRRQCTAG